MARVILLLLLVAAAAPAQEANRELQQAGVCARCHVASVLEWGISGHRKAGTNCTACHGPSTGHVVNERNEVKPDRLPHGAAIAALCAGCHTAGCPKTQAKADCQNCHHVHALLDPKRAQQAELGAPAPPRPAAPRVKPADRVPAGFEAGGASFDPATGLPREVKVSGLGMAMVLVPAGEFDMGSDELKDARPVHTVRVEAFYLGRYEVTQAEWQQVMGKNPSTFPGDRLPVERVSWQDCEQFVAKLNARVTGGGFRLPTEAEWEYACRAGSRPRSDPAGAAWFRDNTGRAAAAGEFQQVDAYAPRPAGTRAPNAWGLYDMRGNVWEWCSSLFRPYLYDASDGRESPDASGLRVLRGGGFADSAGYLDPAFRHGERPDRRYRWNGLRVARSVPAQGR